MGIAVNSNQINTIQRQKEERIPKDTAQVTYKVGDIVSGTVTDVSDQVSIRFSEKEAAVEKNMVPNAKEGDILNFRVISMSNDGKATLQYLNESQGASPMKSVMCTAVLKDVKSSASKNAAAAVQAEEDRLKDIEHGMTEEDYEELSKEGFSLEQYELERFDRALERIKAQREMIDDSISQRIENVKAKEEDIRKTSLSKIDDPALRRQAEAMLQVMNLPASAVNINAVAGAVKLAAQAVSLDDHAMSYLLQNGLEPTPVNIYTANYSANSTQPLASETDWEAVSEQAQNIVDQMVQRGEEASLEDAKWLFLHGLSIDDQTMAEYQVLQSLKENFSVEDTMESIVRGMAEGTDPLHTILADKNRTMVQNAIDGFAKVTDDAVDAVVTEGSKLNLMHLKEHQNAEEQTSKSRQEQGQQMPEGSQELQKELALVTARRQLEEIRVKLTYEAGLKLAGKGINLHTESIENLVNELRGLEQQYYQKLLSEGGAEVSNENVSYVSQTLETVASLSSAPAYVLGVRFAQRNEATLERLAEDGTAIRNQLNKANEGYEPLMTAPRRDMGDSIGKAFAHMDSLMDEIGLEKSEANKRAVRILAYNQMEINETSVEQMKEYDAKVRGLMDAMKPSTVVELIKHKVNPLNTPVDELRAYVEEIAQEHGVSEEERYSNYLVKIQKSNTLTEEEREAYIGVYRLLHQVEKTDGKAIGYLAKSKRDITLNNLLSAVRTTTGRGIDAIIDNSFGTSESHGYEKSISKQLEGVFAGEEDLLTAKQAYNQQLTKELLNEVSPDFLQAVGEKEELMNLSLERLHELCQEYQVQNLQTAEYEQVMTQIQQASGMTDEIRFLKEHHAKVSLKNVRAANNTLHESYRMLEQIQSGCTEEEKAEVNSLLDNSENYVQFQEQYEKIVNMMAERLREQRNHPTLTIDEMIIINDSLKQSSYVEELGTKEYYHIPIEVGEKVVGVGLSIRSSNQEKGRMSIHMSSSTFGEVQADFKMSQNELKGLVVCENQSAWGLMNRAIESVKHSLGKDLDTIQIHVCTSERIAEQYESDEYELSSKGEQTERLFQVAKTLIRAIKENDD